MQAQLNNDILDYIEENIIPRYDKFDKGHGREHVRHVIKEALRLSEFYDVDPNMVYVAAAYHDTGLIGDRSSHHELSAEIIKGDSRLRKWFREEQITTIADAAFDHRASAKQPPRTIYGKIIAEADRQICAETVIRRTIQYSFKHYPALDRKGHWDRMVAHLQEKYAQGGYLKLWIPESSNTVKLNELREIIKNESKLKDIFDKIYTEEQAENVSIF